MRRKTAIRYERMHKPRPHHESSFRHLHLDDETNEATCSTVLGINERLKVDTSHALRLLARIHLTT